MPNNPATRQAGAQQVAAGNKLVRGAKLDGAVAASASNVKASVAASSSTPSSTPDTSPIPAGVIVMWSGLVSAIPAGWALCDGSGGTPDLRHNFVLGAAVDGDVGVTGGSKDHQHELAGGDATAANSNDSAGTPAGIVNGASAGTPAGTIDAHTTVDALLAGSGTTLLTGPGTHTFSGSAMGNHSHTFSGSALANHTHTLSGLTDKAEHLPPFYKLAFIMKLAA